MKWEVLVKVVTSSVYDPNNPNHRKYLDGIKADPQLSTEDKNILLETWNRKKGLSGGGSIFGIAGAKAGQNNIAIIFVIAVIVLLIFKTKK